MLTLTNDLITSDVTPHTAERTETGWRVSFLPGEHWTRDQAAVAMELADTVCGPGGDYGWITGWASSWAARLGLSTGRLIDAAKRPPRELCGSRSVLVGGGR